MEVDFNYIRNRIGEHKKDDLLCHCYTELEKENKNKNFPVWYILLIMKWTFLYGERRYPTKPLTDERFNRIITATENFNTGHISGFIKSGQMDKAFQILYNQQFYLQKIVYKELYATQLKLFSNLKSRYDIEAFFIKKTGFTILDFLFLQQTTWLYNNIHKLHTPGLYFDGHLDKVYLQMVAQMTSTEKVLSYIDLLTLHQENIESSIAGFRNKINREDLQHVEMSFFTLHPFHWFRGKINLVYNRIFNYTVNYFLYDYLKTHDRNFTTEFGYRLEKYIALGLEETATDFLTETAIAKMLPPKSKLVDFYLREEHIFIECKATELQAYPYVNPTDELIFNSLKSSIFKAYFEQLVPVSRTLSKGKESWGIIITFKEMFWSRFSELYKIGKDNYPNTGDNSHLPPENVYIIDVYTWDKIIQIVKDKKATLSEILAQAKTDDCKRETAKQLFGMHLNRYHFERFNLGYLENEIKALEIKSGSA